MHCFFDARNVPWVVGKVIVVGGGGGKGGIGPVRLSGGQTLTTGSIVPHVCC